MVTSNLEVIIDQMENMIQELRVDTKGKIQLPKDGIMQLVDELRHNLPTEIKRFSDKTKEIENDKQRILEDARERAKKIIAEANIEKERLLDNDERIKVAEEEARRIISDAERQAMSIINNAEGETYGIQDKAIKEYDESLQFIIRYLQDAGKETERQMQEQLQNISIKLNEVVQARNNLYASLQKNQARRNA